MNVETLTMSDIADADVAYQIANLAAQGEALAESRRQLAELAAAQAFAQDWDR